MPAEGLLGASRLGRSLRSGPPSPAPRRPARSHVALVKRKRPRVCSSSEPRRRISGQLASSICVSIIIRMDNISWSRSSMAPYNCSSFVDRVDLRPLKRYIGDQTFLTEYEGKDGFLQSHAVIRATGACFN